MSKKEKEKQRHEKEIKILKEQRKLAEKIAKKLWIKDFEIKYISSPVKKKTKKELIYLGQSQVYGEVKVEVKKKRRLLVIICFSENMEKYKKKLNKIMKTNYEVIGNILIYSKKPFN